jgi:hypothetical protein
VISALGSTSQHSAFELNGLCRAGRNASTISNGEIATMGFRVFSRARICGR